METLLLFLAFIVWSLGVFFAGVYFTSKYHTKIILQKFDKEKLRAAYIGDKNNLEHNLGIK